jgi:K+ transporter
MIVASGMFITTTLLTLVIFFVWKCTFVLPLSFFILFGGVDLAFLGGTDPIYVGNLSDNIKIPARSVVSMYSWYCVDSVDDVLALANRAENNNRHYGLFDWWIYFKFKTG